MLVLKAQLKGGILILQPQWQNQNINELLTNFFSQDSLEPLTSAAGMLLDCPLLILDDAFHIVGHYLPPNFSDHTFEWAIQHGEITYEAGSIITRNQTQSSNSVDYIKPSDSPYRRRFTSLISADVQLGYLVCVDVDGHLDQIPAEIWQMTKQVLAKQLFIDVSRQSQPFETTEDILMHLLDGGFSSEANFRLQTAHTYLADFHPFTFALIDLTAYCSVYSSKRDLRNEIKKQMPHFHAFLYKGNVFLFLQDRNDIRALSSMAEAFQLKAIVSEPLQNLFDLPALYRTAQEALELVTDERFHGKRVCFVEQLRMPLLLKHLECRSDLIAIKLRRLAAYDREKDTQYCETLYRYLTCCRSLQKTCDALYTHRNTILYRIRKIEEDFDIPLTDPAAHTDLLLGVSIILFQNKGPDFFLYTPPEKTPEENP